MQIRCLIYFATDLTGGTPRSLTDRVSQNIVRNKKRLRLLSRGTWPRGKKALPLEQNGHNDIAMASVRSICLFQPSYKKIAILFYL